VLHRRVIWSSSSQLFAQRRLIHRFISVSERCIQLMGFSTRSPVLSHRHVQLNKSSFSLRYTGESSGVSSQLSAQRRPSQCSGSVSDRSHTPNSGDLSQVCVLEDVSRSCNHQHSLSGREAFSTKASLSRKYLNFILASGLVKISAICSCVGRYCTCTAFLCNMSLI
jgi:hypothetical protein